MTDPVLPGLAVDRLAEQVEVAAVAGVLVDHLGERVADRADPVVGVPDELQGLGVQPVHDRVGPGALGAPGLRTPRRPRPRRPRRRGTARPSRRRACRAAARRHGRGSARTSSAPSARGAGPVRGPRGPTAAPTGRRAAPATAPRPCARPWRAGRPASAACVSSSVTGRSFRRCTRAAGRRGRSGGRTPRSCARSGPGC